MEPKARQKVLFIGGIGRSGTTIIEKLLNEVPGTFSVGETVHLWERGVQANERCGCGESFVDCRQWANVGELAFGGWSNVPLDRVIDLRWSVDRSRRLPQMLRSLRSGTNTDDQNEYLGYVSGVLHAAAKAAGGAAVLLDSSKHLSTAALYALDPTLDVRVLHIVRDPRGVAYSWMKQVARPEAEGEQMPTYRPSRTAFRWMTDNAGFEALGRTVPTLTMRYEDVLQDPAGSLAKMTALADLQATREDFTFLDGNTATFSTPMHSVAGNPLRFGGEQTTLTLDDKWREGLDQRSRRVVTSITAPGLLRHRYPLR
ncbi:MAG: sulfotransferase [Acidimicrobiales bacterium]